MDLERIAQDWHSDGFVILPGYIPGEELEAARVELETMFPSADGFHRGTDARRERFLGDEFAGIDRFPFASVELSLLAVNRRLVELAKHLLQEGDLRIYSAEAWAKFTGAAEYDQLLHRDYLNHTLLAPIAAPEYQQVEMFVYLVDVPEELGPPHMLSKSFTSGLPARPNWYPRTEIDADDDGWVSPTGHPELYEAEVSAAGPAGTVVIFQPATFHRGTTMSADEGARYTMHVNYRPRSVDWGHRQGWADRSHESAWYRFVGRANAEQLALFGFPPPGHPYWTPEALAAVAQRYPDLNLNPWQP